jgi:hypothetical protein
MILKKHFLMVTAKKKFTKKNREKILNSKRGAFLAEWLRRLAQVQLGHIPRGFKSLRMHPFFLGKKSHPGLKKGP